MDSVQRMDVATKSVVGGVRKPNEARAMFNLPPVPGGDQVYLQKQNWPLEKLGSDNVKPAKTATAPQPPAALPEPAKAIDFDFDLFDLALDFDHDFFDRAVEASL
jgi:hypothetical protein